MSEEIKYENVDAAIVLSKSVKNVSRDNIIERGMWRRYVRKIFYPDGSFLLQSYSVCSECGHEISGWNQEPFCSACGRLMNIMTLQELDEYRKQVSV